MTTENLITLKSGDTEITLPKNDGNIDIIMNILRGMKVYDIMKATPQEITAVKSLLEAVNQKAPEPIMPIQPEAGFTPRILQKRSKWTEEDNKLLKTIWPYHSADECAKQLNRTHSAVTTQASILGIKKLVRKNVWDVRKKNEEHLQHAQRVAFDPTNKDFPVFTTVEPHLQILLKDMLKNVVHFKTRLRFGMDGRALNIHGIKEWQAFCEELMCNAAQVANHFNVTNNFSYDGLGVEYK